MSVCSIKRMAKSLNCWGVEVNQYGTLGSL